MLGCRLRRSSSALTQLGALELRSPHFAPGTKQIQVEMEGTVTVTVTVTVTDDDPRFR